METFYGTIKTTQDALIIFEATRQGLLERVKKRLTAQEKKEIRHGSVFIFDEHETGMKRWTDSYRWSPSRISGNFLVYREVENKIPKHRNDPYDKKDRKVVEINGKKEVTGSKGSYVIKPDGFIKRTISVQIHGHMRHLICYRLAREDESLLPTPRSNAYLSSLRIGEDLLYGQGYRRPLDINGIECESEDEEDEDARSAQSRWTHHRNLSHCSSSDFRSAFDVSQDDGNLADTEDSNDLLAIDLGTQAHPLVLGSDLSGFSSGSRDSTYDFPSSTRILSESGIDGDVNRLLALSDPNHVTHPFFVKLSRFPDDYVSSHRPGSIKTDPCTDEMLNLESLIHFN